APPRLGSKAAGSTSRPARPDHTRKVASVFRGAPPIVLPTEVPITVADSGGGLAGDGKGPIYVSLDPPTLVTGSPTETVAYPDGRLVLDQLGTSNLVPLIVGGQINPVLAANHIQVIKDTHGKTSHLSAADVE